MTTLDELIIRVESGTGPDRDLDEAIAFTIRFRPVGGPGEESFRTHEQKHDYETAWIAHAPWRRGWTPAYSASLDGAVGLLRATLPGFWWRGGTCAVSSEAIVCPDHNCPINGERLRAECPPAIAHWNEGIEVELRPGSDAALVRAFLAATLRAVQLKGVSA